MKPPVFIIGAPRSGTTLLLDLLSAHRGFAWISRQQNLDPHNIRHANLNRLYDVPVIGGALFRRRYSVNRLPNPVEPWKFWDTHLPGFRRMGVVPRNPVPGDFSKDALRATRRVVEDIQGLQNKDCFLSKYTDFPRINVMRAVFPDAKFIHLVRNPYAVASSYAKRCVKGEFSEWRERDTWKPALPRELQVKLATVSDTPLNLTAALTRWYVDQTRNESNEDYVSELAYEDLTADPEETCRVLLEGLGLSPCDRLSAYIQSRDIRNMDHKWMEEHDEAAQAELKEIFEG